MIIISLGMQLNYTFSEIYFEFSKNANFTGRGQYTLS